MPGAARGKGGGGGLGRRSPAERATCPHNARGLRPAVNARGAGRMEGHRTAPKSRGCRRRRSTRSRPRSCPALARRERRGDAPRPCPAWLRLGGPICAAPDVPDRRAAWDESAPMWPKPAPLISAQSGPFCGHVDPAKSCRPNLAAMGTERMMCWTPGSPPTPEVARLHKRLRCV